jgi:hypothetical protein
MEITLAVVRHEIRIILGSRILDPAFNQKLVYVDGPVGFFKHYDMCNCHGGRNMKEFIVRADGHK